LCKSVGLCAGTADDYERRNADVSISRHIARDSGVHLLRHVTMTNKKASELIPQN